MAGYSQLTVEKVRAFLTEQREQLIVLVPVPVGIGILIYFSLGTEPIWSIGLVPLLVCLFGLLSLRKDRQESLSAYTQWIVLCAVFLASLGFCAAKFQTERLYSPILQDRLKFANITGDIRHIEMLPEKGAKIILSNLEIEELSTDKTPKQVRVKIWKPEGLKIGQRVTFLGQLSPPSPPVTPGGFDFQRYAYFQGLGAFGFGYETPRVISDVGSNDLDHFRQNVQNKTRQYLATDQAGVVTALLTGIRGGISEDIQEALRHAGLAHLLAISGLHVGLVAGFLFFFSRLLMASVPYMALRWPIKKISACIALAGAIFYTFFVGAPVPTQRALIMTAIALFAIMIDRSPFSMRLVAVAALWILLVQPATLMGASFQLSFAAVISLIAFYEANRSKIMSFRRGGTAWNYFIMYLVGVSITSVIATLGTAPFSLYHFQQFAAYSVIGNILAMPLMVFWVMPCAVMVFLLWPVGLEWLALNIMGEGVTWIIQAAIFTAELPGAVWRVPQWPPVAFSLMVIGGLWLCLIQGKARRLGFLPLVFTVFMVADVQAPDIRVSENGKLIALTTDDGALVYSNRRRESFVREVWARQHAQDWEDVTVFKDTGSGLQCDVMGCRGLVKNKKVAIAQHPYALKEDCRWADIIISPEPVFEESCREKFVIDRFDVWRRGAHALYIRPDNRLSLKTVAHERGDRPWMVKTN